MELLVVITIIGILIALLLPAVQAAREAARTAQCANNVKQLALGCLAHESMTKRFPTGGWGYGWTGDPDRGNDWRQPGGWIYNVLPYIEQQPLHDLGIGTPLSSQAKLDAGTRRVSTPFSQLNCPTRRRPIAYPWLVTWYNWPTNLNAPSAGRSSVVRTDYAMCGGEYWTYAYWRHPVQVPATGPLPTVSQHGGYLYVDDPQYAAEVHDMMTTLDLSPGWPQGVPGPAQANGVSFALSMIGARDVTDGLSNTYLLGEKYLWPDAYEDAIDPGDDEYALPGLRFRHLSFCQRL